MAHLPTSGFPRCTQQYPTAAHTPPDTTPFHTTATVTDVRSLGVGRMTAAWRMDSVLGPMVPNVSGPASFPTTVIRRSRF